MIIANGTKGLVSILVIAVLTLSEIAAQAGMIWFTQSLDNLNMSIPSDFLQLPCIYAYVLKY